MTQGDQRLVCQVAFSEGHGDSRLGYQAQDGTNFLDVSGDIFAVNDDVIDVNQVMDMVMLTIENVLKTVDVHFAIDSMSQLQSHSLVTIQG